VGGAEPYEPVPQEKVGFNMNIHEQAGLPEKRQDPAGPDPVSVLALAMALAVLAWIVDSPESAVHVFLAVVGLFRPEDR
jgi:hypothetical protein